METELPTLIEAHPTSWAHCSAGLKKLLVGGPSESVRIIAVNPKLRAEAERLLPALEAAKAPATAIEILQVLIKHAPAYGVQAKSEDEWDALFDSYIGALRGLPLAAIEEAFLRWNRGEGGDLRMVGFYPKSGQLCILAEKAKSDLYVAAYRARKALERDEARARPPVTPDERKAVGELMKGLREELRARAQTMVAGPGPRRSPHEVAADLRRRAEDVGDVI